jgi:hypothetical protein
MYNINLETLRGGDVVAGGSRAHTQAYACLRHLIQEHISSSTTPFLSESPRPVSGYQSVEMQGGALLELVQDNAEFVQRQDNRDFLQHMEGMLVTERENPGLFEDLEQTDIQS